MPPAKRLLLATGAADDGGVWRHVRDLADGMRARGLEVSVARGPGALREAAAGRGVLVHLHLHDTFDPRALAPVLRRRAVVTEHLPHTNASDPALLPGPRRRGGHAARTAFKRTQLARAAATIVVSHSAAAFMTRRYRLRDGALTVIPNGVTVAPESAEFPPAPAHGPLRIVAAGALIVQKGIDVLIDASALARCELHVDVVGDGPHRSALGRRARERDARVTFHGRVEDVEEWLRGAHGLCMPSRWEGLPYAALEAMALGRPVLASAVDGLAELLADGAGGRLVAPEDPRALAAALDEWAADPAALASLGNAARDRVASSYRLDEMLDRTLEVYEAAGL